MQLSKVPNKPVMSSTLKAGKSTRNPNGHPRPYLDGRRWKAPGYFLDSSGVRHKVIGTGPTQRHAVIARDRRIQEVSRDLSNSLMPSDSSMVGDFCHYWLNEVKIPSEALRIKTISNYQTAIDIWIKPFLNRTSVVDLTKAQISSLMVAIVQKGLSKSSQVQVKTVLKQALDLAIDLGARSDNPVIGTKMQKRAKQLPIYFTKEECAKILSSASRLGTSFKWELALYYGLRQGERLGLRWKDLQLDTLQPTMTIQNQLQRQTGNGLVLMPVKTSSSARVIPLLPSTLELARTHFQYQQLRARKSGSEVTPEDFVFTSKVGGPVDCANDRKEWQQLLLLAKVPYRRGHAARHTAATMIGDLNQASKLLGHSSIQVTADFYSHVPQVAMAKALQGVKDEVESL